MKLSYILLALLDTCLAKERWKLGRDSCTQYNEDAVKAAVTEGITIAETAWNVLDKHYPTDAKVQQMVKYIFGDGADLQDKVNQAKDVLGGVKKYEKNENMFFGPPFIDNEDVVIFCDKSNYDDKDGKPKNVAIANSRISPELWANVQLCYDPNQNAGGANTIPMAITTSSDGLDYNTYLPLLDAWKKGGMKGPRPDMTPYIVPRTILPNTIDVCTWYLKEEKKGGFAKIDKVSIAKIQQPAFLAGLKGNDRAVDVLAQSLGATFLHELTHTNLGGKTVDNAAKAGCYGWKCVTDLHDARNADSINILGVALQIWSLGFYVDKDGTVKKI